MAEIELDSSVQPDPRVGSSKPLSRLEQIQANLHRKLLQEKEEKLIKLCNDNQQKTSTARNKSGNSHLSRTSGGNVRKFFEERRAMENVNLETSMTSLDSYFLNASNGLIARNNLKNSTGPQRPKKGSPIGWDKSYPLLPIERTNSGSSSGYESLTSQNKSFSVASSGVKHRVPHIRRQSLDRYKAKEESGNMRRSKSQILNGTLVKDDASKPVKGNVNSPNRAKSTVVKENRFARDEEKRKLQQEMRRREQELINKIKEQQAEIERMRQEKIKEEKAQKARLYRKSLPTTHQEKIVPHSDSLPNFSASGSATATVSPSSESKMSSGNKSSATSKQTSPVHTACASKPLTKEVSKPVRDSSNSDLPECDICGRRFAADRIEKHLSICKKSNSKKRKVFDPVKMRTQGTEQESFVKNKKNVPEVKPKKSNWRQKHENFLQTIRQAKIMQDHLTSGGKLSDLPPPPPLDTSDYIQCPHCGRKFSEAAAERHIPKCQTIRSNKK